MTLLYNKYYRMLVSKKRRVYVSEEDFKSDSQAEICANVNYSRPWIKYSKR